MRLINDDYSVIENDLNKVIDAFNNTNDKDILISAYRGIEVVSEVSNILPISDKINEIKQHSKKYKWADCLTSRYIIENFKHYKKNRNFYIDLYKDMYLLIDNNTPSKYIPSRTYTKMNEYDMYKILYSYYNDSDNISLELFNKGITQGHILRMSSNDFINGETLSTKLFDNTYIKITDTNDFEQMMTILHENSHAKYFDLIENDKSYEEYNRFIYQNDFIEVYPVIEELKFLKYLIDNNIMVDDAQIYLLRKLAALYNGIYYVLKTFDSNKVPTLGQIRYINGLVYSCLLLKDNIQCKNLKEIEKTTIKYYYDNNYNNNDIKEAPIYLVKQIQRLNK